MLSRKGKSGASAVRVPPQLLVVVGSIVRRTEEQGEHDGCDDHSEWIGRLTYFSYGARSLCRGAQLKVGVVFPVVGTSSGLLTVPARYGPYVSASESVTAEARLGQIQAVTDSALVYASAEGLLDELLDRLQEILKADTAVVLLLDRSGQNLIASAAKGVEEEAIQRSRVPVGEGLIGRIATELQPMLVENIAAVDLYSPLLVQRGIRSVLGVPLIANGALVGVLHVGSLTERRFTGSDVELLQLAADRAALAVKTVTSRAEQAAARALQESLLPTRPPKLPGVEIAVRYVPGTADVGGDWYDAFALPTGEVCLAIGDVAGHGLDAAVIMGRLRSALRAYALVSRDPAEVLYNLDNEVQTFEADTTATVLYAVCDPSMDRAEISSAGHLPPVIVPPGQPAAFLDISPDPLIGSDKVRPRRSTTVKIPQGSLLCLYTDGLVEHRDQPIGGRLTQLRESLYLGLPEAVCTTVMATLIGRQPAEDDIAMLVLRRNFNSWRG
jgi:phosphoserine phosphatase RsbU/P